MRLYTGERAYQFPETGYAETVTDDTVPDQRQNKYGRKCWTWTKSHRGLRTIFRILQALIISVPIGISFGMRFPSGPLSLGPDETGILSPMRLLVCGAISSLTFLYTMFFVAVMIRWEDPFFDWVEIHPPFFTVLVIVEFLVALPAGILAAVLFYQFYEGLGDLTKICGINGLATPGCKEAQAMSWLVGGWAVAQVIVAVWLCSRRWWKRDADYERARRVRKARVGDANDAFKAYLARRRTTPGAERRWPGSWRR